MATFDLVLGRQLDADEPREFRTPEQQQERLNNGSTNETLAGAKS